MAVNVAFETNDINVKVWICVYDAAGVCQHNGKVIHFLFSTET